MEIRLHGRGGQGGVTCAKILATVYAKLGKSVQTFGDYAGERSGAPVRAYTRTSDGPITNRNKVYHPDQLLVLDPTLMGAEVLQGLAEGGSILLNTKEPLSAFDGQFEGHRLGVLDATAIARKHGIGTKSLVIVNTTIAGAYTKLHDLPLDVLESAYQSLGLSSNFPAAKEAYESVEIRENGPVRAENDRGLAKRELPELSDVVPLDQHTGSAPTGLRTGSWGTQKPVYMETLAPCNAWCPAGNDVVGFVRAVETDGVEKASEILGRSTPLAAVCGRVCPAPCMEGCNRAEYDGAVNIRGLERHVADAKPVATEEKQSCADPKRVAILGSGPAGLAAAYELARRGHLPTIYEAEEQLGGVLRTGIPEYRLPREVLDLEISRILALGVETKVGTRIDKEGLERLGTDYDAVILATGLQKLRALDCEGAKLDGIEQGIGFLHTMNLGEKPRLDGHVVVLGGGNTAMDCARSALRAGAERVTVAYRRTRKEMPAIREEIEEAAAEGIEFELQRQPVRFSGNGRVQDVTLAEVDMGEPDESGRRRPVVSDRTSGFSCDHVLLALGQSEDRSLLPDAWELDGLRMKGTGDAVVFAAGDFATWEGTVTHAIGNGRRVAGLVLNALGDESEAFERPNREEAVPFTEIRVDHFDRVPQMSELTVSLSTRTSTFEEVNRGLESGAEAKRCFSCGHCTMCDTCLVYCPEGIIVRKDVGYEVEYSFCKGCGVCVEECPRSSMEMISK